MKKKNLKIKKSDLNKKKLIWIKKNLLFEFFLKSWFIISEMVLQNLGDVTIASLRWSLCSWFVMFAGCQLTDESRLKTACEDHQLCVIAVLPHILDCQSECRNDYLSLLRRLGDKHKKRMWGWVTHHCISPSAFLYLLMINWFICSVCASCESREL